MKDVKFACLILTLFIKLIIMYKYCIRFSVVFLPMKWKVLVDWKNIFQKHLLQWVIHNLLPICCQAFRDIWYWCHFFSCVMKIWLLQLERKNLWCQSVFGHDLLLLVIFLIVWYFEMVKFVLTMHFIFYKKILFLKQNPYS